MNKTPALEIHDLTVAYRKKPVLWGIDLCVAEGSLVGIVGPNGGCGRGGGEAPDQTA